MNEKRYKKIEDYPYTPVYPVKKYIVGSTGPCRGDAGHGAVLDIEIEFDPSSFSILSLEDGDVFVLRTHGDLELESMVMFFENIAKDLRRVIS